MPQLDKVTFLSQVFWGALAFNLFYVILLKFILPVISKIIKIRQKKSAPVSLAPYVADKAVDLSKSTVTTGSDLKLEKENKIVASKNENLFLENIQTYKESLSNACDKTSNWVQLIMKIFSQQTLKFFNKFFINIAGSFRFTLKVALKNLELIRSSNIDLIIKQKVFKFYNLNLIRFVQVNAE
jgi:hypothetical protein